MLFAKTPSLLSKTLHHVTWDFYGNHRKIYLTFDDGPTPEVTDWVLDQLSGFGAKATFFCLGRNVEKYPDLFHRIHADGHAVGNHTYSHLKGFRASVKSYVEDVELAESLIKSRLFRPPYGRIYPRQVRALMNNYRIIMWDVLSGDYNERISGERVFRNVVSNICPGSIIVFHDSEKAAKNLYVALPRILSFLSKMHYEMVSISDQINHEPRH